MCGEVLRKMKPMCCVLVHVYDMYKKFASPIFSLEFQASEYIQRYRINSK